MRPSTYTAVRLQLIKNGIRARDKATIGILGMLYKKKTNDETL
jgi:hypothetical protein